MQLLAITAPGLEDLLRAELAALGARMGKVIPGGVEFSGRMELVWRANLWSRLASRIVIRVDEFHASSFHELERKAKKVAWKRFAGSETAVRFRVTCRKSRLYHSDAVAERLMAAAAKASGANKANDSVDEDEDDAQLFIVRIADDVCTISADSSGALLHRRGYRQAVAKAPLRETLAAAMLLGCKWDPASPLVDPMCGSGTIPIEAAMIARRIAPGVSRKFGFERWPDHRPDKWTEMVEDARSHELPAAAAPILASDRDAGAVTATLANAERAGVKGDIDVTECAVSDVAFPDDPGWIVSNPPYGLRVGESLPLRNLYSRIGNILRDGANGYLLALLSADRALESQLRLNLREVFRTTNGGIPVRLITGR